MRLPIGGPKAWRRLVSRWGTANARMRREWDERAAADAKSYIGRAYAGSDESFWASGEADLANLVLANIDLDANAQVLEIGCGIGRLLRPIAALVRYAQGVDISPVMIERARALLFDLPNVKLATTEGRLEGVADGSLDLVYSFVVFQHIPAKPAVSAYMVEAARTLKSGGIFRFQVDGRPRRFWRGADTWLGVWYRPKEIHAALKARGFAVADTWGEGTQYYWITAVRSDAQAAPTALARARLSRWNRESLAALLRRLGHGSPQSVEKILRGQAAIRDYLCDFLRREKASAPELFVRQAYRAVLDREPDTQGLAFYTRQLTQGASRAYLLDCLVASPELRSAVRY